MYVTETKLKTLQIKKRVAKLLLLAHVTASQTSTADSNDMKTSVAEACKLREIMTR